MSIASEITNYANGLSDAYDAVNDMQGIIPTDKNMNNLDTAIRTIPQNQGSTYTAGNGINIDANNEISIDTTVVAEVSDLPSTMTGASASTAGTSGLVPAPAAGDQDKVLKGDGTWGSENSIIFMVGDIELTDHHIYRYERGGSMTTPLTDTEVMGMIDTALEDGKSIYIYCNDNSEIVWQVISTGFGTGMMLVTDFYDDFYIISSMSDPQDDTLFSSTRHIYQQALTAGSNITISGTTISATDTTYSAFTGATSSVAGTSGLVPAPTTSDPDKFLKGDGTWATVQAGGTVTTFYWNGSAMYKDSGYSTAATMSDVETAASTGPVKIYFASRGIYEYLVSDKFIAGESFSTVWADVDNKLRSVIYTYTSNTWSRTSTVIQNELTAGSNISISSGTISATDTTYSDFTGATSSVAGTNGLVPAPTTSDTGKYLKGDGTWGAVVPELVEMSYGESNAWAKFIAAYNAKCIVYCRASSNANPGSGAKTRKAFMAYVNNETTPTQVEFQYYRSVSSHSASQQGDQVFVYVLKNDNSWSVTTREASSKIVAGTGLVSSYSSGTLTLSANLMTGATSSTVGAAGMVPQPLAGEDNKVLRGGGTWTGVNDYSTSEVDTGSTWIDGSHIYKKTIEYNDGLVVGNNSINHGISNLKMVINKEIFGFRASDTTTAMIPMWAQSNQIGNWTCNDTSVQLNSTFTWSDKIYITLYYTKS